MRRILGITAIGVALISAALACSAPSGQEESTSIPISPGAVSTTPADATSAAPTETRTPIPTNTIDSPTVTLTPAPTSTVAVVSFPSGGTSATVSGSLTPANALYVLRVLGGQIMHLTLMGSGGSAALGVYGPEATVLLAPEAGKTEASVQIPETGDYLVAVRWLSGDSVSYTLVIEIPPLPGTIICEMTTNADLTAYFDPTTTSEVFGQTGVGLTVIANYRTSDGWIGFDPGVAQAGNEGMDRMRWIQPGAGQVSFDPIGCDAHLPLASP